MELRYFWKQFDDEGKMMEEVLPWTKGSCLINKPEGFKTQEEAVQCMEEFCKDWMISPNAYTIILVQKFV